MSDILEVLTKEVYVTLDGEKFDLSKLSREEWRVYWVVRQFWGKVPRPGWAGEFPNFWSSQLVNLYGGEQQMLGTVLYEICQDLEAYLGIKQGYIMPPEECYRFLKDRGIACRGKLIFFFYAVRSFRGLTEERVQSYLYLLHLMKILPLLGYPFRHRPEPHSDYLQTDLEGLTAAGYLEAGSEGVTITEQGVSWVEKEIPPVPVCQLLEDIIRVKTEEFVVLSDPELFGAVLQEYGKSHALRAA
ncbi:MAG: hypothetical protein PHW01_03645 [Patescibacteria group bacterium]|nr:hypothetical protein [Patescibacteria group bacterium]